MALACGIHPVQLVEQMGRARILVRSYYPGVTDYCKLGREVARDVVFTSFARCITYLQSAKATILRYYFSRSGSSRNGAGYGAEVPFVHSTVARCQCLGGPVIQLDRAVERRMGDQWAAFASTGTPAGLPTWGPDNRTRGWALEIRDVETDRAGFMTVCLNAFITALNIVG